MRARARRARRVVPRWAAPGLLLVACGAAPAPVASPAAPVGELPGASPAPAPSATASNRGDTGTYARVVLGSRRERVTDLLRSFLRGLMAHDLDTVRSLFADTTVQVDSGEPIPAEVIERELALVLAEDDVSQLAGALERVDAHVYSQRAWTLAHNAGPAMMSAGDWWIDLTGRDVPASPQPYPQALWQGMLVRWVGETPRIVGVQGSPRARR